DAPENRLRKFNYRGKDASLRQQQRIAVSLELRKAKKDEQILKRRNITSFCPDTASEKPAKGVAVSLTLGEIIKGVNSSDSFLCFQATQTARKILSQEKNPLLKLIIEAGLIPRMVEFLKSSLYPCLQFEAAWALINIPLIKLLSSHNVAVCEQAMWALGNIPGDGLEFRDNVISSNAIPHLLTLISPTLLITFLWNITWTLSNLCLKKTPYPCETAVKQMLPALSLLQHHDSEVLSEACWSLSYLTDGCKEHIGQVVDTGVLPRLVALMTSSELNVWTPSLCTVGNIITGTDEQKQMAIDVGMLNVLPQLLQHNKPSIQKEAAWALSNVVAGPSYHTQQLLAYNVLPPLVKEAVWTVANFAMWVTVDQLIFHSGVLEPLANLLIAPDVKIVLIILDVISCILQAAEKRSEKEILCFLIEELGGIDRIEALQLHENCQIGQSALSIIEKHFGEEEDESLTLLSQVLDQDCEFTDCECLAKNSQAP
uniref:Importin subunit alpha n=1 Tax=Nomascus leucogenys TaxID=61853 RepID=A0A2I3GR37_NOMLE